MPDTDVKQEYREAYEAWQKQLAGLHDVVLEGARLDPVRLKGLLNRESRAKRRYDKARSSLLGIEDEDSVEDEDNPAESRG